MNKKLDFYLISANIILACTLLFNSYNSFAGNRGLKIVGDAPGQLSSPTLSSKGEYRALIIGNNAYRDPEALWKPLKRAVSDAKAIETILVEQYGFSDVQRLENASRSELLHALRNFSKRINIDDNVLVYYAGHGFLDQYNNKGYWVPVDAQGTDHTTFVRNSTIRDEISDMSARAKHTLLISDSCFSGTLLKTASRGIRANDGSEAYLKSVDNKKSVQILTAGGVEYVDDDYRSSGHSPFTYFLQSELKNNPYPVITASDLSRRVQVAVSNNVEQVPQIGVLQGAGDELGEFLFIRVNLEVSGVPKERIKVKVNVISDTSSQNNSESSTKEYSDISTLPSLNLSEDDGTGNSENNSGETNKADKQESMILPVQSF